MIVLTFRQALELGHLLPGEPEDGWDWEVSSLLKSGWATSSLECCGW
jgi:hypothetical protein